LFRQGGCGRKLRSLWALEGIGASGVGAPHLRHSLRGRLHAQIFRKAFPEFTGTVPAWRDHYRNEGYEDDAVLATQALYDGCLKPYAGQLSKIRPIQ